MPTKKNARAVNPSALPQGASPRESRSGTEIGLATRFAARFPGYSKAYGESVVLGPGSDGKVEARHRTVRGAVSEDRYQAHLNGIGPGLGIVMLRDDNTALFGAIDHDVVTMDHAKAEKAVKEKGLPLVLCRSKSGGGHFYCFTREPVPADLMRDRLAEWTAVLGMAAKTEQFPKQSSRFNEEDVGSFINLPYFNANETVRYAIRNGEAVDLKTFLDMADQSAVSLADLSKPYAESPSDLFANGPPCLIQAEREKGFGEGCRNNGMMAVATYLKKRFPDDWRSRMAEYNRGMGGGLGTDELKSIEKSQLKKDYDYQCKLDPLVSRCDKRRCVTQRYGVGQNRLELEVQDVTCHRAGDEVTWFLTINRVRTQISNDDLYDRNRFNKHCMAVHQRIPVVVSQTRWLPMLNEWLSKATVVEDPEEASEAGELWEYVERFCTVNVMALTLEEVWSGKAFLNRDNGKVYFRITDLYGYLRNRRVLFKPQRLHHLLREHGAETLGRERVSGKPTRLWTLPAPLMPDILNPDKESEPDKEEF
jgi:hypothetical protein